MTAQSDSQNRTEAALQLAVKKLTALNPDDFEIFFQRTSKFAVKSRDYKVESLDRAEDVGLSVRLIRNQRQGFSFTTSLEPISIEQAIETAARISTVMPSDAHLNLQKFSSFHYDPLDVFDQAGLEVPTQQKIERAFALERACRQADKRVTQVRAAAFSQVESQVILIDGSGKQIETRGTGFSASITCKAEQGEESQMGSDFAFSATLADLKDQAVGKLAAEEATCLLGATVPTSRQCPAIFRNNVVADLLEFMSSSFSAEDLDKGTSLFIGKMDKPLFSPLIHIVDDGRLAQGYATSSFDSEGVPAQTTHLVEGGVPTRLLYDSYYARKKSKKPTGNASRGIKSPPRIGITNLYLKSGNESLDSLIRTAGNGVLITDLMGVHTANPVTGEFSLGASGLLIENGKISRPLRGFAVAGNVLGIFQKTAVLGSDSRAFGSVTAPSLLMNEISVSGN